MLKFPYMVVDDKMVWIRFTCTRTFPMLDKDTEIIKYKVETAALEALIRQPFHSVLYCLSKVVREDQNFIVTL